MMKQSRKEFTLLAASGCFSFRLFLCGRGLAASLLFQEQGTRSSPVSSHIFLFCCVVFLFWPGLTQEGEDHNTSSPVGEDPKHPRVENTQTHFIKLNLTVSQSRPGASSGKSGRASNNPIMFCSLASSLTAKYFRRRSLFFPPCSS